MRLHPSPLFAVTAILLTLAVVACGGSSEPEEESCVSSEIVLCLTNQAGNTARLDLEIADSAEERTKGLSMRDSLPEDTGMLFVIERRGPGFWMKDTTIPLSVAFVAPCGEIVHLADMQPLSLEIVSTPLEYRFGLEVNQGWFAALNIAIGDKLELPASMLAATSCPAPGS